MDKSSGPRRTQEGGRDFGSRDQAKGSSATEVFVGNLSWNATEDDLRELFTSCGRITRVKLLMGQDGRSKGAGFVGFEGADSVDMALQMNGNDFMGRALKVSRSGDKGSSGPRPLPSSSAAVDTKAIFVGNVSYSSTEDDLRAFFSACGTISSIRLAKDADGLSRGFAHVEFESTESVAQAVGLSGKELLGRAVRVEPSVPRDSAPRGRGRGGRGSWGGPRPAEPQNKPNHGGWD